MQISDIVHFLIQVVLVIRRLFSVVWLLRGQKNIPNWWNWALNSAQISIFHTVFPHFPQFHHLLCFNETYLPRITRDACFALFDIVHKQEKKCHILFLSPFYSFSTKLKTKAVLDSDISSKVFCFNMKGFVAILNVKFCILHIFILKH